ncbi:MAG: DUF3575 domain-containing protein [Paramuribaculum sp.]|nr:DUF3575 domain-containing protein [Paramuribaculum sp.]
MKHFLLILTLLACSSASFETLGQEVQDSARIYFRQGKSMVEPGLSGNKAALDSIVAKMNSSKSDMTLEKILVVGAASPEGSVRINRSLSQRRADSLFHYISLRAQLPDSLTDYEWVGRDWNGLYNMALADNELPYREDVLSLLGEIGTSISENGADTPVTLAKLKALHGGVPYRYMYTKMFPALRASKIYAIYSIRRMLDYIPGATAFELEPAVVGVVNPVAFAPKRERKPFYMSLSTNMLYDALALPNIGAEFYLGKNWSIAGNWIYGWWDNDNSHRYWRAYGGDIAVRKWFGRAAEEKPLTGHHLGIYAGAITYDFEMGGTGYMGGLPGRTLWDRCNFMGGIEYGYSLPVSKHINIDFTIGLGYLGGKYIKYVPDHDFYVWKATKNLRWFGPTKVEVSLVWLLGHDNYNRMKGCRK